jgi:putative ABC transport system permease protein
MWTLWQDIRYSARLLLKHPGFTVTAIGVLTLGIGVNAGIFAIVNGLLIRPLAGAEAPGEVVGIYSHDRTTQRGYRPFSYPGFADIREANGLAGDASAKADGPFQHLAAHNVALAGITENGSTRQAMVDIVSTGYFASLGVAPVHGRDFSLEEERPGTTARSAIASFAAWERSGFNPGILTSTVRINGEDYGIVGVAPKGFSGTTAVIGTEYFLPLGVHDRIESDFDSKDKFAFSDRRNRSLIMVGRLKPGITRDQANSQLQVLSAAHEKAFPADNKDQEYLVRPLSRLSISTSPQDDAQLWAPFALLQGLAACVLLISCLNLANMMLAFGSARQKEIAIRLAVGGARFRIVRQLLVQGLLLSMTGGAIGLVVASWAVKLLFAGMGAVLPFTISFNVDVDYRVALATFAFGAVATVAFGLWPALRLSRPDLLSSLKDQAGEISGRIGRRVTVRGALVTAQLALSLALLVLSGLFVRGASAGASADAGFRFEPLTLAHIDPKLGGYDETRSRESRRATLERLRATPGIESVAAASVVPFGEYTFGAAVQREGPRLKNEDPDARGKLAHVLSYTITSDYFRTVGVSMLRGREFTAAEEQAEGAARVVIIDKALADELFPNEDPIGQNLQYGANSGTAESTPMQIVGVAPTLSHDLFSTKPETHIYRPTGGEDSTRLFIYARAASGNGHDLVESVRSELRSVDADLPVMFVKSFRSHHEGGAQVWMLRAGAQLFLTMGLAAAFVAVAGLYGVRSYLVSRRTREFGVRMAIGASPADVLKLVMRETISTTTAGLAIGLGLGTLMGWGMSAVIYQISPLDPITLGGATGLLAVSSIVASLIPARRAANVLPMTALRND